MSEKIELLKLKSTEDLLGEIQRIAFGIRLDNMAAQEAIDHRVKILRARGDHALWEGTEYAANPQATS